MSEAVFETDGPIQRRPIERDAAALEAAIHSLRASGVLRDLNGTADLVIGMEPLPDDDVFTYHDFQDLEDGDRH